MLSPLAPALKRKGGILSAERPHDSEVARELDLSSSISLFRGAYVRFSRSTVSEAERCDLEDVMSVDGGCVGIETISMPR